MEWFNAFQKISKTTMQLTRTYPVKENKIVFRELKYCIHSNLVKQKIVGIKLKVLIACIIEIFDVLQHLIFY